MAIDTAEKRQSVPGIGRPWHRVVFPIATPDVQWRASVGNSWGANGIEAPPVVGGRIMSSLAHHGGLAGFGGIAGSSGGLAG